MYHEYILQQVFQRNMIHIKKKILMQISRNRLKRLNKKIKYNKHIYHFVKRIAGTCIFINFKIFLKCKRLVTQIVNVVLIFTII